MTPTYNQTGSMDSAGRPIFQSSDGGWYVSVNGKMSPLTAVNQTGWGNLLSSLGLTDAQGLAVTKTGNAISGFTAPASLYQPALPDQFKDQATSDVSPYYDKNLELMNKSIDTLVAQHRDVKAQEEKYQGQQEQSYYKTEDQGFAHALNAAQNNFAGMGTWDSGGRMKIDAQNQTNREDALSAQGNAFQNATDTRNLGFSQFLTQEDLDRQQRGLDITRSKNDAILADQQSLANVANQKNKYATDTLNQNFSKYLGIKGNFA